MNTAQQTKFNNKYQIVQRHPTLIKQSKNHSHQLFSKSPSRNLSKVNSEKDFITQIQKIGIEIVTSKQISKQEIFQLQSPEFGHRIKIFSFQEQQQLMELQVIKNEVSTHNPQENSQQTRRQLFKKLKTQLLQIKVSNKIIKNAHENLIKKLKEYIKILSNKFSQVSNLNDRLFNENRQLKKKLSTLLKKQQRLSTKQRSQSPQKNLIAKINAQKAILQNELKISQDKIIQKNKEIQKITINTQRINQKLKDIIEVSAKKDSVIQYLENTIKVNTLIMQQQIKNCFAGFQSSQKVSSHQGKSFKQRNSKIDSELSGYYFSTCGTQNDLLSRDIPSPQKYNKKQSDLAHSFIDNNQQSISKQSGFLRVNSSHNLKELNKVSFINHQVQNQKKMCTSTFIQNSCFKTSRMKGLSNIDRKLCKLISNMSQQITNLKNQSIRK